MHWLSALICAVAALICLNSASYAATKNGFDLSGALVRASDIKKGGPPRDGIPAINHPRFESADTTDLPDGARVLGLVNSGVAKAYPVRILVWHEIVNDHTDPTSPLLVTYCPLCGSGMAYTVQNERFGVSGLLYQSDVLMYDKRSHSLWTQIGKQALTGPRKGEGLKQVPMLHTDFLSWKKRYPDTLVLSANTGFRNARYTTDSGPYEHYEKTGRLLFPVNHRDRRLRNKTWILGVSIGEATKAYHLDDLLNNTGFQDTLNGQRIFIHVEDAATWITDEDGKEIPSTRMYWFAWAAFHPETMLWKSNDA